MKRNAVWLPVFAVAMALLEAAVVVLSAAAQLSISGKRTLDLSAKYACLPRPRAGTCARGSNPVMLLGAALLAERGFVRVFAAFVYVFGLWDIF
ncbi:MAG: hypothetical protein ACYDDO_14315 [Acidiferrobacterales bacterium]